MRRLVFGLSALLPAAFVLMTASCTRQGVLRVVNINDGLPAKTDIADFGVYKDPTDPTAVPEFFYVIPEEEIPVTLQYLEVGPGLPTVTPYEAVINQAKVTFKGAESYDPVTIPLDVTVQADQTGKTTTTTKLVMAPASWKEQFFGDQVSDPPDYEMIDDVEATVTFTGVDSVSGRTVTASGKVLLEVGNIYDDPTTIGR